MLTLREKVLCVLLGLVIGFGAVVIPVLLTGYKIILW